MVKSEINNKIRGLIIQYERLPVNVRYTECRFGLTAQNIYLVR